MNNNVILITTIDGRLHCIKRNSGEILWTIDGEHPLISVEFKDISVISKASQRSSYLVDPTRDGQIFIASAGSPIKKLPFSMKKLVEMSPFKSLDGSIYLGLKKTEIIAIDINTGVVKAIYHSEKEYIDSNNASIDEKSTIFIAKTQYSLLIFETHQKLSNPIWNITMTRYHSPYIEKKYSNLISQSSLLPGLDGSLINLDSTNSILWKQRFETPIISILGIEQQDDILQIYTEATKSSENSELRLESGNQIISDNYFISILDKYPYVLNSREYIFDHIDTEKPKTFDLVLFDSSASAKLQCSSDCHPGSDKFPECLVGIHAVNDLEDIDYSIPEQPLLIDPSPSSSYYIILSILLTVLVLSISSWFLLWKRRRSSNIKSRKKKKAPSKKTYNTGLQFSDEILGYGSNGTVVIKAEFQGRTVAVKRLLVEFYELAENEINLLLHSDDHPNVIRYFCLEKTHQFIYIALEMCVGSLFDLFDCESSLYNNEELQKVRSAGLILSDMFLDILSGLNYIHRLNIVHRDIKPHNILINYKTGAPRLIISDFGLCKKLSDGQASFHHTFNKGTGSFGWRSPEILMALTKIDDENGKKTTNKIDIFAAGLVFYYIISKGKHAYGDTLVREGNICNDDKFIDDIGMSYPCEYDLIKRMLRYKPEGRPSAEEALAHPTFWNTSKKLSFILDLSDRMDVEDRMSQCFFELEQIGRNVLAASGSWIKEIDPEFFSDLGKYRSYDGYSFADLLRAIRNKKNHYHELPESLKEKLGILPDGYLDYFMRKFPLLIISAYNFVDDFVPLKQEAIFSTFFPEAKNN